MLDQYGIRLNVIGKRELLPENVLVAVEKAEEMTRKNNKYVRQLFLVMLRIDISVFRAVMNLCMPYASRDDITAAIQQASEKAVESGDLYVPYEYCQEYALRPP